MRRRLEPELMEGEAQVKAYAEADFTAPNRQFVDLLRQRFGLREFSGKILDLGCGPADIAYRLLAESRGAALDALDGSATMLRYAQAALPQSLAGRVRFLHTTLPDNELQQCYGLLVSNSLLHHLHNPQTLWDCIKQCAQPGAFVAVMDLCRPANTVIARRLVRQYADNEPEVLQQDFYASLLAAFTPLEITEQLRIAGLDLKVESVSDRHVLVSGFMPNQSTLEEPRLETTTPPDINQANLYINRELSLLEFNQRVLAQAQDEQVPLLERLNYLCISCSNLDEFFEVRVASLLQMLEIDPSSVLGPDGLGVLDQLEAISVRAHRLVDAQYQTLNQVLIPALEAQNIRFIRRADWSEAQQKWLARYFEEALLPILTPVGLDSAHPFPRILNKSLNFIVSLTGKDAFGRNSGRAVLQAPRALPRIIQLPVDETDSGSHDFVFLSSIIHAFVNDLFNGMTVKGCYQFRVTRNSDLFVDDDATDDLLHAVEGELAMRNYGDEVRLEIDAQCPDETVEFLLSRFGLTRERLYLVDGPVNLSRVQAIYNMIERPDLKFQAFKPALPAMFANNEDLFAEIRRQDILLHHPFESFLPVVEFLRQAASDPDVLLIKQTLYRTGPDSPIVDALVKAARAGKEVTVVIELRARFDEQDNIDLAARLQNAAANVVYGVVGYKTHAKMCMVLRREGKKLRNYVHLGTGNYHPKTARIYTDYGLFSYNQELGEDVRRLFMQLTSLGKVTKHQKLLQSPFTLHKSLLEKIEREIQFAQQGKVAQIIIKVNSVVEPLAIRALYRASQAGVRVKLIVRGICCLRPGVPGVSDNIEVRSIIGRFLEHTRVYAFANDGAWEVYAASADLMDRNMFRRVEICFPIENKKLHDRVLRDLDYYLKDNTQSWQLQTDGSYQRLQPVGDEAPFMVQAELLRELGLEKT